MKAVRFIIFLLLPFLGLARNNCWKTFCRIDGIQIRFPFWLNDQPQPDCCFPGFDLSCNNDGIPVLNLSESESFLVRNIDYYEQEIQLYDSSGCIQRRLLEWNLSSSPFWSSSNEFYTFLSCPTGYYPSQYQIDCLSNLTNSIFANSSDFSFVFGVPSPCKVIAAQHIPVPLNRVDKFPYFSLLGDDLKLKWHTPSCNLCEKTDTLCRSSDSEETGSQCSRDAEKDEAVIRRKIILGTVVPTVCIFLCIVYYTCSVSSRQAHASALDSTIGSQVTEQGATAGNLSSPGLHESIIKSFTTIVVVESQQIPGPNGSSCSICLAEYLPGDTLRSMPQCEHCFHVDCIDEWLRLKGICPICRKSPSADCLPS